MFASINLVLMAPTDNFEAASQPIITPEERKRLLSFVVCGGGPTGIETAAVRTTQSIGLQLLHGVAKC